MTGRCPETPDLFAADLPAAAERLAEDAGPGRWPTQLVALTDLMLDEINAYDPHLDPLWARRLAYRLVVRLSTEYGGDHWYIPKKDALERLLRDLWLWAEHDGTVDGPRGITALARQCSLSAIRIWAILKAQRQLHRRRVQPDLFEGLDADPGKGASPPKSAGKPR